MNIDLLHVIESGYFDLHIHTTASDGIYSPRELVKVAKSKPVDVVWQKTNVEKIDRNKLNSHQEQVW